MRDKNRLDLASPRRTEAGDLCVVGADEYSDSRDELVPLAECERTRAAYGEAVELPVEGDKFVEHVRGLLADAARKADLAYPDNPFFTITNG